MTDMHREAFEQWYIENAFMYGRDPIGSRECGLQWAAWQGAITYALRYRDEQEKDNGNE